MNIWKILSHEEIILETRNKNISMKNGVFSVAENDKENKFSKVSLENITEYFDSKSMELKCQPKIEFCLKIVNEKLDEFAKDKKENVESGNIFLNKNFEQILTT